MPAVSHMQVLYRKFKVWSIAQRSSSNLQSPWSWSEFIRSKREWPGYLLTEYV